MIAAIVVKSHGSADNLSPRTKSQVSKISSAPERAEKHKPLSSYYLQYLNRCSLLNQFKHTKTFSHVLRDYLPDVNMKSTVRPYLKPPFNNIVRYCAQVFQKYNTDIVITYTVNTADGICFTNTIS